MHTRIGHEEKQRKNILAHKWNCWSNFSLWRLWFSKRFGANHYFICSVRAMQPFTRQYGNIALQTDIYSQIVDESLHNVPLYNHRATEYNLWSMKKAFYVNPLCQYYEMFLQFFDSLAFVLSGLQKCWLWCQHSLNKQSGWSWSSLWLIAKRIYFFIMMLQHSQLLGEQKTPIFAHLHNTSNTFFCAWHFVIFMIE